MSGLFDGIPYVAGSATSEAAAESMIPHAAACLAKVYRFIFDQANVGATRDEIEVGTGLPGNTVRPRVVTLLDDGRVIETTRTRTTRGGRQAVVLVVAKWATLLSPVASRESALPSQE